MITFILLGRSFDELCSDACIGEDSAAMRLCITYRNQMPYLSVLLARYGLVCVELAAGVLMIAERRPCRLKQFAGSFDAPLFAEAGTLTVFMQDIFNLLILSYIS